MERPDKIDRILKPEDILLPTGYKIEVFAEKLTTPITVVKPADSNRCPYRMTKLW